VSLLIGKMYVTLAPCILAGILNMLWCRTSVCRSCASPIDRGRKLRDGRRIFGDNKTFAGFFGMIVCGCISQLLWGYLCGISEFFENRNYVYGSCPNTPGFNLLLGGLTGFAYVLFELPNSFIKRRLDIPSGKTVRGIKGAVFFAVDQIDSLLGVVLVISFFYPMPVWQYWLYILLGAGTHIAVNSVLYLLKIRKNL